MLRGKGIIRNISYSFSANLLSLIVSAIMVMVVPKFLSVDDYGMWQLFLFYFSYLGFFHFGWEDGIYLRYAGKEFDELSPKKFSGQFYAIIVLEVVLAALISSMGKLFISDSQKQVALICAIWLAPLVMFNSLCNFILQITNQIKKYAKMVVLERLMLLAGVLIFLMILGLNHFYYMYAAQVCAMVAMALCGFCFCRKLFVFPPDSLFLIWQEAKENISVGIKLMIANIASMLIIGIVRYGISWGWDVATFGRVSLTLGISNFLMVFINSISVVFFPMIKRMDSSRQAGIYLDMRNILTAILFGGLLGYYPVRVLISWWLPKYADSLIYMSVLFPVCVFEGKMSLLVNTYLKSMRKEATMLRINILSVIVSAIVTFFTVGILHDLNITVFSIVWLYAFRCFVAEYVIGQLLELQLNKKIIVDFVMCAVFILSGWLFDSTLCLLVYGAAYIIYLLANQKNIIQVVKKLKY